MSRPARIIVRVHRTAARNIYTTATPACSSTRPILDSQPQPTVLTASTASTALTANTVSPCRLGGTRSFHTSPTQRLRSTDTRNSTVPFKTKERQTLRITTLEAPHTGTIRIVSLNRPGARNAISRALLSELREEIEAIHREAESQTRPESQTRVLVLASESDDSFCAGADLKERKTMTVPETEQFLAELRATFARLAELPIPAIAAVSGMALGGGLELALCTHLRVFSQTAVVGLPETRLAIIPGAGGTYRLPAVVGLSRALDMVLTGRKIGPAQALKWGLCNYVSSGSPASAGAGDGDGDADADAGLGGSTTTTRAPVDKTAARDAVLHKAVQVAMYIADGGPTAIRAAVQAMRSRGSAEQENAAYELVLASQDRTAALQAFAEKKKPVFRGE